MNTRLDIEKAILGAIIYCDGYAQVAHILTPKNFSSSPKIKHQELFTIISNMFPHKPIDMITVTHEVEKIFPGGKNWVLRCNNYVTASSNLTYWALMLLQIDVTDKFKVKLIEWKERRDFDLDYTASGALKEIIETITPDSDIFTLIESALEYFDLLGMEKEQNEARQFSNDFLQKAEKVRKEDSVQRILNNLYAISRCEPELKDQCDRFGHAIADIIKTGQTNERYTKALQIIYN